MHTNGSGKSASALEREVDETRAQLSATLDELRFRMTPGQVVDQLVDVARDSGGGDFVRNLGRQAMDNPIPALLVGAGIAWLMAGPRLGVRSATARSDHNAVDRAATASDVADAAAQRMCGASDKSSTISNGANDAMKTMSARASDAASAVAGRVSSAADAAWESGHRIADAGYSAGGSIARVFREQPLLIGAMGVAIGAAIAAALPQTDIERDYVGPTSDSFKEEAQRAVQEHYEQLKSAATGAMDAARSEMDRQFDSADEVVRNAGERLTDAADRAMGAVERGVQEAKTQLADGKESGGSASGAGGKETFGSARKASSGAASTGTLPERSERA